MPNQDDDQGTRRTRRCHVSCQTTRLREGGRRMARRLVPPDGAHRGSGWGTGPFRIVTGAFYCLTTISDAVVTPWAAGSAITITRAPAVSASAPVS